MHPIQKTFGGVTFRSYFYNVYEDINSTLLGLGMTPWNLLFQLLIPNRDNGFLVFDFGFGFEVFPQKWKSVSFCDDLRLSSFRGFDKCVSYTSYRNVTNTYTDFVMIITLTNTHFGGSNL